jgi:putative Mn2+ efflux pump MntP
MNLFEIIAIAVGLAMDAFAVSITLGLSSKKLTAGKIMLPGIYFGVFQALMPMAGFFAGVFFADKIRQIDHWLAFALLAFIGVRMIKGAAKNTAEDAPAENSGKANENPFGFVKMLILSVATSIDALAVGISFAFFAVNIYSAALITGVTTFLIAMGGVVIGNIFGAKYKTKAEIMGGAILVLIGVKIVIEHTFFQ